MSKFPYKPVKVSCLGKAPHGLRAWIEEGSLIFSGRVKASYSLGDFMAVAPPRWNQKTVEICCINGLGSSELLCFTTEGNTRAVRLPKSTVDAFWLEGGWAIALANPSTGHILKLGRTNREGKLLYTIPVPLAWKVHGESFGRTARWVVSRLGVRTEFIEGRSAVKIKVFPVFDKKWENWTVRSKGYPAVPVWVKAGKLFNNVWIVLHGGPGLSWDTGMPKWLELAASPEDTIVLVESPGSVGFGGSLLKWGVFDKGIGFHIVMDVLCNRIRRIWPDSKLILAGESDGASLVASCVCVGKTRFDIAILINGEYEESLVVQRRNTKILFVSSSNDNVVDSRTIAGLSTKFKRNGMKINYLVIEDDHRWRLKKSVETMSTAVIEILTLFS